MNVCKVCKHPERVAIDSALARGIAYRKVAAQVSGVSPASIERHRRHLPSTLVRARNAEALTEATSLLSRVEALLRESEAIAKSAKRAKEWPAATAALREARSCLELLGKLSGELQKTGTSVKVGVAVGVQVQRNEELPANMDDLEKRIAAEISALTDGYDPAVIARLKSLSQAATPVLSAHVLN